ncbi:MAG TPA: TVP38/TMEM64 family protein [Kiritimatiellia bacterium]|nr:TVP38/TMEM64 family protein [Kiritimatiellia bacterium]HPJ57260.1 TVP38/TMEM64 family protein [Kiritimatiellia bacterium]HPR68517.1 TVP38/TMEM64 family protein [Kiritimatiellia bacterium]HRX06003.1 TVP38/TMEM64 family protein [Kiritimatiellia bacterium]
MSRPFYRRKRNWSALALLAGAALAWLFRDELGAFLHQIGWEDIRAAVLASGPWAPLLCILLYAVFTVLFLPTTLVGILVGLLYGPWRGLPICLAGLALGMASAFLLSRYLLHDWIQARIGHTRLYARLTGHLQREGWKLVMFTRLLPINPFGPLNYAYGLTAVPFRTYLAASTAGVIPNTLALLWTTHAAGQLATGRMDTRILLLLFAGAALFALLAWLPRFFQSRVPPVPEITAPPPE